jgi:hypothetical protein
LLERIEKESIWLRSLDFADVFKGEPLQGLEPACEVVGCNDVHGMKIITRVWTWIRIQIRDLRPQLRLCLRVTVAAVVSFVLGKSLNIPFGGLWAVLTAVVVTQTSVGGSLKGNDRIFDRQAWRRGLRLILPANEISLLIALAIAVAPLALLAAINTNLRVGPYTAVIVIVGSSITHAAPSIRLFIVYLKSRSAA